MLAYDPAQKGEKMIEIRAMDEDFLLPRCLHHGPIEAAAPAASTPEEADLPPHPWSDEAIRDLVARRANRFVLCDAGVGWPAEFMREMIRRHGTCALLAWEAGKVVGFVRFYPMTVARLAIQRWKEGEGPEPILDPRLACKPEEDEGTLWVHCVMTSRPYTGATREVALASGGGEYSRAAEEAGGRKGVGLALAETLVPWAREHGWRRIIKVAHPDLDWFYGIWGGGGKEFWQKAGFEVVGTIHARPKWADGDTADTLLLRAQAAEKGMTQEEIWTFYRVAYEL